MRTVYIILYLVVIPFLWLLSPIILVMYWVQDLLMGYWWYKAIEWADELIAKRRNKK